MIEKGNPSEFEGKSLSEIQVNIDEYVDDNDKGWTTEEIKSLKEHFKSFISKGTYPCSSEIKEFGKSTNNTRSVAVIKSKIQHFIRLNLK
ncbi:unnamed protein product [Acanthoscelides obtectus]|uniref:Uncharacterized protein n=1 Tax=Acanthoscelides obtectus TaxID=200917 RepID=A0A9P0KLS6_ACAOB|nr:unnamed protein product [Acanthoscelides obtectus]CAK1655835.1 hypothetical protein AOBTE_LOCUS19375 [Acanthoscelides obtectus]